MEIKARKEVERGAKTDLFRIMEERGRDRLTSGVWERALKHGDDLATRLIDRAIKALGVGIDADYRGQFHVLRIFDHLDHQVGADVA